MSKVRPRFAELRAVTSLAARFGLLTLAAATLWAPPAAEAVWRTGYYASYSVFPPSSMSPGELDYSTLTHVIHWPVVPRSDGTFDPNDLDNLGLTEAQSAEVVSRAHAVGVKALLGFGGNVESVGTGWRDATAPAVLPTFIANMVALMQARGYDGIDINWEGITGPDGPQFVALIQGLRAALDGIAPLPLLTIVPTTGFDAPVDLVASVQNLVDQINIQTYVMSGAYPGWVTWFNSPLFNGGFTFPSTGEPVPSIDAEVDRFVNAGIPAGRLGIGVQFDGFIWQGGFGTDTGGASKPRQSWTPGPPFKPDGSDAGAPVVTTLRVADVIATYTTGNGFQKHFDDVAKVPWIGRDDANDANDHFISFDDEQAIGEKAKYINQRGLGGIFVFELSGDFFPAASGNARHPLLSAIRDAFAPAPPPSVPFTGGVFVAAGDLDGDGRAEIITGPGVGRVAEIRAFDADGNQRFNYQVYDAGFQGGVRVAACDFDGDGRADIVSVAGPTGGPHVRILKLGPGGAYERDLANFLAYDPGMTAGLFVACGDIDGDGTPEVILGVDAGGGPHVRTFQYAPGTAAGVVPFIEFFAYDPGFYGGIRVAAGDIDGDGRAEIITGAGPAGGPHVRVLSWTGSALVERAAFFAYDLGFRNGIFVAAGDLDGDGRAEIVTSADAGGGPHVRAWTGTGGDTGISFFAYDLGFTGGVRVAVGDVDGAAQAEIVTGAGPGGGPHVGLFSGADGAALSGGFFVY